MGYQPGTGINFSYNAKSEGNTLLSLDLNAPGTLNLEDGIFELRIQFSSDISRIFYFFYVDSKIIVTNGFIKKTQKTPQNELKKALKYKKDYERKHPHE